MKAERGLIDFSPIFAFGVDSEIESNGSKIGRSVLVFLSLRSLRSGFAGLPLTILFIQFLIIMTNTAQSESVLLEEDQTLTDNATLLADSTVQA